MLTDATGRSKVIFDVPRYTKEVPDKNIFFAHNNILSAQNIYFGSYDPSLNVRARLRVEVRTIF